MASGYNKVPDLPYVAGDQGPVQTGKDYIMSRFLDELNQGVTFLQSGTGAVARTVQSRLRETVSVADFGAVGDGSDETTKLQAALDSRGVVDAAFTLLLPWTSAGYGFTALTLKNSNVTVEGIGGKARLLYVGTAAAAATGVRADKSVDHWQEVTAAVVGGGGGGTGYALSSTFAVTFSGGSPVTAMTGTATTNGSGVVTSYATTSGGWYPAGSAGPTSITGGSGSGATVAATMAGQNYVNLCLKNIEIDGAGNLLIGFYGNGFSRRCKLDGVDIHGCVNPLKVTEGYYSNYENVELRETPQALPAGMAQGTFDANKFAGLFDVCHATTFKNFVVYNIGGNSSNTYTAALRFTSSEAVNIEGYTIEAMDVAVNGRYVTKVLDLQGSTTVNFDSGYWEGLQSSAELIRINDNAEVSFSGSLYMNGIKATCLLQGEESSPIRFGCNIFAENLDISNRLFLLTSGTAFRSLSFGGATTFIAGALSGVKYSANSTTNSKQGIPCDPILLQNERGSSALGYVKRGYTLSITGPDPNNITVAPGEAIVNGQAVQFLRNTGHVQLLVPDITVADTWNVKISSAGSPYIERQSALKAGSTYALTIGTFTTAGGSAAPAGLVAIDIPVCRLPGLIKRPVTSNVLVNEILTGDVLLADTGAAANSDLFTLTLSATGGEGDGIAARLDYVAITTTDATRSVETGSVYFAFTQDSSGNRVAATPVKVGTAQALDAGMATLVTTFTMGVASNVATAVVNSETSANVPTRMFFELHVMGGTRTSAVAALSSTRAI